MLHSKSVLGLSPMAAGVEDVSASSARSGLDRVLEFIANPMRAALGIAVYLVWFLTAKVDASQNDIKKQLEAQASVLMALSKSDAERILHERQHDTLLRMICRGVNKGDAKEKCDQ